jgi:arabinofuranosyltransferase
MNDSSPFRLLLISLLTVFAGSALAWLLLGRPETGIDDADIFFVYARHLADGNGFVYNIGGEHVEGFTSMLWTLMCAGLFHAFQRVEIPLYLLNLLLGTVTVWACLRRVERPMLFLFLLTAAPAWFAWCQVTLMESGLWCMLLTLLVLAVAEKRSVMVALLLPLLIVTRPEAMLWGAWLILMLGLGVAGAEGWRKGLKAAVLPTVLFAAALACLVGFRLSYFGYPVPNTYYAKVSPNILYDLRNGMGYLLGYLFSNTAVTLLLAIWLRVLIRSLRDCRKGLDPTTLIALCLLPGVGIPVLVGGDHFGGYRFYQTVWPVLCLLAVREWPAMTSRFRPNWVAAVVVALVVCGWLLFPFTAKLKHEFRIARDGRETGAALAAMFRDLDEYPTVATITAGGSKFAYPGTVLDLMGLNATEMAHAPGLRAGYKNHTAFNRDIFYEWHPDILLCGEDAAFDGMVLKGLPFDDRFRQMYLKVELQRNSLAINAYYSHRFLERLHNEEQSIGLRQ